MNILEFLERTNNRNFMHNIDVMVKQRMRECAWDLENRREKLYNKLQDENLHISEQLAEQVQARASAMVEQRQQWIDMSRLKFEQAEEELRKLKRQQRERENCEELREVQSKQILIETKRAQLYQIEERKALCRKERHIDQLWQQACQRLDTAKAQQDHYERKLRQVLAGLTQAENVKQLEAKCQQEMTDALKQQREYATEHTYAAAYDAKAVEQGQMRRCRKKLEQDQMLKTQIQCNAMQRTVERHAAYAEEIRQHSRVQEEIMQNKFVENGNEVRNRVWHQAYLAHSQKEREAQLKSEKELADVYLGTGCVLHQVNKQPYGRSVR